MKNFVFSLGTISTIKVRQEDKEHRDITFSITYSPDFYLRGNFDTTSNNLVIDDLYHHLDSPTAIEDAVWVYGTYTKQ